MSTNLIPFTLAKVDEFYQLTEKNRLYLKKWLPWLDCIQGINDTENFVSCAINSDKQGHSLNFFICDNKTLIGTIGLRDITPHCALVGYWLDEAHQGKGIITKSLQQLLHIAQDRHLTVAILLRCAPLNKASAAIAKKCGFVYKTTLPQAENLYGRLNDLDVYEFKIRHPV